MLTRPITFCCHVNLAREIHDPTIRLSERTGIGQNDLLAIPLRQFNPRPRFGCQIRRRARCGNCATDNSHGNTRNMLSSTREIVVKLVSARHLSTINPFTDTVYLCRKLISAPNLTLDDR